MSGIASVPKPVTVLEHLVLSNVGTIRPQNVEHLDLHSDGVLCVTHKTDNGMRSLAVDLDEPTQMLGWWTGTERAVMNREEGVAILLRAHRVVYLWSTERNERIETHTMDDEVELLRWVAPRTAAIVTSRAVFHWSVGSGRPVKMFPRDDCMVGARITDYKFNFNSFFCVLVGHFPAVNGRANVAMEGVAQVFNCTAQFAQTIDAHAVTFVNADLLGYPADLKLFAYAACTPADALLHVVVIDDRANHGFITKKVDLVQPLDAPLDFPIALHASGKYGIVYIITKMGYLHAHDLESGAHIYTERVTREEVITTSYDEVSNGIIAIDMLGRVFTAQFNENGAVPHILGSTAPGKTGLAFGIAGRTTTPLLYVQAYLQLSVSGEKDVVAGLYQRHWCSESATTDLRALGRVAERILGTNGVPGITVSCLLALRALVLFISGMLSDAARLARAGLDLDANHRMGRTVLWRITDVSLAQARGDEAFRQEDYPKALDFFNAALRAIHERKEEAYGGLIRATMLSKRSTVHVKLEHFQEAIADADACIKITPAAYKAIRMRGHARTATGNLEGAVDDFKAALSACRAASGIASDERAMVEELEQAQELRRLAAQHDIARQPRDYYRVLGISRNASDAEIRQAYRQKTLLHHPDKGGSAQSFAIVKEALDVLTNPRQRRRHDLQTATRANALASTLAGSRATTPGPQPPQRRVRFADGSVSSS